MRYVEIDARNPFKQTKFQELEKYVKPNYYMSFTKLPKLGINPKNAFIESSWPKIISLNLWYLPCNFNN